MQRSIKTPFSSTLKLTAIAQAALLASCASISAPAPDGSANSAAAANERSLLVYGGPILTMEGAQPAYAEALLIEDGVIRFAGGLAEARKLAPQARKLDLKNKTAIPGIIDAHSHANSVGMQQAVANLYAPPDGKVVNIPSLLNELKDWAKKNPDFVQATSGWIMGNGYDDAELQEKRHPTADELDLVSKDQPVLILHQSGHLASANHKALELLNINADTQNPEGGVIRRVAGSTVPNGVLEESAAIQAMMTAFKTVPPAVMEKMALKAVQTYAANGYTTIQEGRADRGTAELWRSLAARNKLPIDVVAYPDISSEQAYMLEKGSSREYANHFRIGGVKISLDGSPQGKTAWLTQPYIVPPAGLPKTYRGYPAFPQQQTVQNLINLAFQNNWQILAHANGDAAVDQGDQRGQQQGDHDQDGGGPQGLLTELYLHVVDIDARAENPAPGGEGQGIGQLGLRLGLPGLREPVIHKAASGVARPHQLDDDALAVGILEAAGVGAFPLGFGGHQYVVAALIHQEQVVGFVVAHGAQGFGGPLFRVGLAQCASLELLVEVFDDSAAVLD